MTANGPDGQSVGDSQRADIAEAASLVAGLPGQAVEEQVETLELVHTQLRDSLNQAGRG